jgi:hypothetical protein
VYLETLPLILSNTLPFGENLLSFLPDSVLGGFYVIENCKHTEHNACGIFLNIIFMLPGPALVVVCLK